MLYCDSAATNLMIEDVVNTFNKYAKHEYGNPSAGHAIGKKAAISLNDCNRSFSQMIGALEPEIVWTSGATESNNTIILSFIHSQLKKNKRAYIFYHPLSHVSLIEPLTQFLENPNISIIEIPFCVNQAMIDFKFLIEKVKNPDETLILLPFGNNELGLIDDYGQLTEWVKENGVWVHFDAAQSLGKIKIDLKKLPCHSMSFSGHKLGAPVGIGALFIRMRPRRDYQSVFLGGGQQEARRAGTVPLCLIQCFVAAVEYWLNKDIGLKLYEYQKKIITHLNSLNSSNIKLFLFKQMLPHIVTFYIAAKDENKVKIFNEKVIYSKGSACSSQAAKGSHQLSYLGYSIDQQTNIYRLSIGPDWTEQKNNELLKQLTNLIGD